MLDFKPRMTCPNISFVMNKLSQFMHAPSENHLGAVKLFLRYLNGTRSLDIRLLANTPLALHGFSDTNWANNLDDRTSTGAFFSFLGANPISWSSTKQCTIVCSFTKAKYCAIVATAIELQWVKYLLSKLAPVQLAPTLFSDNLVATYLSGNPFLHSRMKYLAIDYHDMVQPSALRVVHVSTGDQLANALTKPLS